MDKQTFMLLMEKIVSGTATDEELSLYNRYFNYFQQQQQEWDPARHGDRAATESQLWQRISSPLGMESNPTRRNVFHLNPRTWTAAAAVLLLLAGGWLLLQRQDRQIHLPATDHALADNLPPGGDRATLTLADGATVDLGGARNGAIATQGATQIVKVKDGHLSYRQPVHGAHPAAVDNTGHGTQTAAGNIGHGTHPAAAYNTVHGTHSAAADNTNLLTTPKGGQYRLTLPDGSQVWLNAGSSLRFPTAFTSTERRVELTGEGYFEIAKDPTHPFTVHIKDMDVAVLGTHFNVMAYADETNIKTSLLQGAVRVRSPKGSVLLARGQQSQMDPNGLLTIVDHADLDEAMAWKNGIFDFDGADIEMVMRQLARWYDVEIVYKEKIDQHFTGKIDRNVDLRQALQILGMTEKVHFNVEGRKIIVSR